MNVVLKGGRDGGRLLQAHDELDFETFVRAHWSGMLRAAFLMGVDASEAEDVAQDALASCLASWSRVRSADDPKAYLYRVLINKVRKRGSRLNKLALAHRRMEEAQALPPLDSSTSISVREALACLPAAQRNVIILRHLLGMSVDEVADVLAVPVGTVKSRTARGLESLRNSLGEDGDV